MIGRATLDSNIPVYAELEPETPKGLRAQRVIEMSAARGVIAAQAMLEFVAVVRRRRIESLSSAIAKVEAWSMVFEVAPTTNLVTGAALTLVCDHHFQVWDAVIWSAARRGRDPVLVGGSPGRLGPRRHAGRQSFRSGRRRHSGAAWRVTGAGRSAAA